MFDVFADPWMIGEDKRITNMMKTNLDLDGVDGGVYIDDCDGPC